MPPLSAEADALEWLQTREPARLSGRHLDLAVVQAGSDTQLGAIGLGNITTDPENIASQRVAERCGFRYEGRLRSHLRIRHSGERRDSLLYSLLPGDAR
jgi:hypothetical protein